jgi:hypothetical protein
MRKCEFSSPDTNFLGYNVINVHHKSWKQIIKTNFILVLFFYIFWTVIAESRAHVSTAVFGPQLSFQHEHLSVKLHEHTTVLSFCFYDLPIHLVLSIFFKDLF